MDDQRERASAWSTFVELNSRQPGNKPDAPQSESALYYWVNRHRRAVAKGTLNAEICIALDEVDPTWREATDPTKANPALHAGRAADYRAFIESHGRRPSQLAHHPRELKLHQWMANQRAALATGHLSVEVQAAISATLPDWDAPSRKASREFVSVVPFEERLAVLRAYMDANSGLLPPSKGGGDGSLGRWLAQQRRLWRRGELKRSRKRALDGLTLTWMHDSRNEGKWNLRVAELAVFVEAKGQLPRNTRQDEAEGQLSAWMQAQRSAQLSDDQTTKLDLTVPSWRGHGVASGWSARVQEIELFVKEHGHRPRPHAVTAEESRMGFWLTRQRRVLREGKLSEVAVALLDQAMPGWESPEVRAAQPRVLKVGSPRDRESGSRQRKGLPTDRRLLIEMAQRDVTNKHPLLPADDPYRYAHKVVNRYVRLAVHAGILHRGGDVETHDDATSISELEINQNTAHSRNLVPIRPALSQ